MDYYCTKETKLSALLPQTQCDAVLPHCWLISSAEEWTHSALREIYSRENFKAFLKKWRNYVRNIFPKQHHFHSYLSFPPPLPLQSFEIFLVNLDDKFFNFNLQQYMHEIQWIL